MASSNSFQARSFIGRFILSAIPTSISCLASFAECCKFVAANSGDGGPEVDIWDRMRGVRIVEISYDKRYAADDGAQKSARVTAKVAVTSCGVGRPFR